MILNSIMKRNEDCGVPDAAPVSDSSASSSDFEASTSLDSRILSVPLEIGDVGFRPSCMITNKRVSFGDLQMRKYPVILGDHPECTMGPPITIGWESIKTKSISIDDYEAKRGPRRTRDELQMGWIQRKQVLRSLVGATDEEMREAACEAQRIRDLRNQSRKRQVYEFVQLPFESLNRKLKRAMRR